MKNPYYLDFPTELWEIPTILYPYNFGIKLCLMPKVVGFSTELVIPLFISCLTSSYCLDPYFIFILK